ncbi:YopX family protein [Cytobacillus pseudoceanisediminis]|uniref:YopX family protein n=1 Tax=Cytobacillus pseudoceanisediminis TaxID=3051614 RepID=UPI0021869588|nr:YopX family protein [Cytobacillus pseudoceanisediminis]UQX52305.1 YopX family protein [Cytobacillus pseudoceanisediminis]
MREIKYRGLEVLTGDWVHGSHVKTGAGMHYILPQNLIGGSVQYHVDKETVGQYIGLKDKNGKEVVDADVVKWTRISYTDCSRNEIHETVEIVGRIYWHETMWAVKAANGAGYLLMPYYLETDEFEVIGNIHENPELLEV